MSVKKDELVRTAETLFYQSGFHAVGLKRIVQESNIAMMTMYNHFKSKDELVLEVLRRRDIQYMAMLNHHLHSDREDYAGYSAYMRIATAHAQWLADHASNGCLFLRAKEEYGEYAEHEVALFVHNHKHRLKQWIQQANPTYTLAQSLQLLLLMEGITALSETENTQEAITQFLNIVQQLFPQ